MNSLSAPAVVDSGTNYSEIATADKYTCGITTGGVLKCWGGGKIPGWRPESNMPISRVTGLEVP